MQGSDLFSSGMDFTATNQSGYGADGASCTYSLTVNGSTYSVGDDSASTPVKNKEGRLVLDPLFYKFTAHTPVSIGIQSSTISYGTADGNHTGYWVDGEYVMLAKDHLGNNMPALWVQERFPNGHLGFTVKGDGDPWTTDGNGTFPDSLGIDSYVEWTYAQHPNQYLIELYQQYFGATSATGIGAFGILLSTFVNDFWTDTIIRH